MEILMMIDCSDLSSAVCNSPLVTADRGLHSGLHVAPRALVLVLFLRKDQLCIGVLLAFLFAQVERERANLL